MHRDALRRAFIVFHLTLGIVVFIQSVLTALHAAAGGDAQPASHFAVWLGIAEAMAALLFLVPATLRIGAVGLLMIFFIALTVHGLHSGLPLLVYGAGVVFVMVHGSAFGKDVMRNEAAG
ncbi:MAG: hypothetical protein HY033_00640 [Ignavibacteriae bacterium]|nr:hypothetical protein [Ignavibacteria bacterium]MBI3363396.1 hypothetical protein [Ignavibacteriota bacterium]